MTGALEKHAKIGTDCCVPVDADLDVVELLPEPPEMVQEPLNCRFPVGRRKPYADLFHHLHELNLAFCVVLAYCIFRASFVSTFTKKTWDFPRRFLLLNLTG